MIVQLPLIKVYPFCIILSSGSVKVFLCATVKGRLSAERLRRRAGGNAEMHCIKEGTGHQEYRPDLTESIGLRRRAAYNISQMIPFVNGRKVPYSPSAIYARFIAEAISAATSSHMISPSFGDTK